eukprot:6832866-Pyramimonas_sp.AAC.1
MVGSGGRTQMFNHILPDLIEFYQDMDTRRAIIDSVIDHTARLDRISCSLPSATLADLTIATSAVGRLKIDAPSDHIPVAPICR